MLWSQIIYGHRTASISPKIVRFYGTRPAAGRIVRFFIIFLDIVRCPVKLRYSLKFHGAVRHLVASLRVKWHRPGTLRCPDGARPAFAHIGRAPDNFCFNFISYDINGAHLGTVRGPARHCTMSYNRQKLSKISHRHRPMFYESNCHRWETTCFCRRIYIDISLQDQKHNTKYIHFD